MRSAVAVVVLDAVMFGHSASPPCPADRPVDDIIAATQTQQAKRKHRNTNPLPMGVCIFGWCIERSGATRTSEPKSGKPDEDARDPSATVEDCNTATELALAAAHDAEVGDYYLGVMKYDAALLRYSAALEQKPRDPAIHVRLGRVLERLQRPAQALDQYEAAQKLADKDKWADEAKSGLLRLRNTLPSQ